MWNLTYLIGILIMSEDDEMSTLKDLYDELWDNAKKLIKDMMGSISLYKYSSLLLLGLNIYPIYHLFMWEFVIPRQFINDGVFFGIFSYLVAIVLLTFFGFKLLRTYLKLKKRYSKLWKMRLEVET